MRRTAIALQVLVLTACADSARVSPADAIRTMLEGSAEAWNAGDFDGFMASYAADSATTFVGYRELVHGYDAIRANYAPLFEEGAQRDSLRFDDMDIRVIDPLHAVAYARWVMVRNGDAWRSGPFTLVLEFRAGAWRIIHDHSSTED